ncbi:ABC transporter ATP-binding protein [Olsenella porci]|uniref:Fatty acid ABC transporter ATP-binding/permease protein n=1 Tax=Olsenella porci TaxID=2652279 RepID=A0A6N7XQT8_9ACTN|nr:ABC transporter ATP-binding protein [Olsenella porci]MST71841.1 ABC transporter ATP-binding protein [Olsenella porci]
MAERVEQPRQTPRPHGPGSRMAPGEKAKDFGGTIRKLLRYMGPYRVGLVSAIILAMASVVFSVVGPKILGNATTEVIRGVQASAAGKGGIDFALIGRILVTLLCIYLASAAASGIQSWIMTGITQRVVYRMRGEIADKISKVPLSYFDGKAISKGDVLSRMTNDVDTLSQSLNQGLIQLVTSITQVVGVAVMMISISLPLAGVTFVTLPVSAAILAVLIKRSQRYFALQQQQLGAVNGRVEEDFSGQVVIQAFDRTEQAVQRFEEENDRLYESAWKSQFLSGLMQPLMNLVGNMGYVGVVVVGAGLAVTGAIQPGDIQSFIQYVKNFTQPITQLATVSNVLQQMAACAERVFEFLEAPEEEETARPDSATGEVPAIGRAAGRVDFDDVSFGYLPGKTIIHDFSANVEPGKTVAIVGPTGAGKTTLMKLLLRFYDVDSGSLSVDGHDVRDVTRADLRQNFSMVLQDAWLFKGTIRENIRFGRLDATDEEVEAAARYAHCEHFIKTLPGGYDFELDEGATNISQGQRQLLTIARAVLADRPILILDEATSNVDTRTEWRIQRAMDKLMAGRTSFVIAHRLSTIRNADTILVLRDGDIVEKGTHEELLAAGGFYAQLYQSQFDEVA